jgi:hypothetical protein
LTGRLSCGHSETGQTNRRKNRTYPAAHSTGISEIPRLQKDLPPLRFQKRPFSTFANLISPWDFHICFLSEKFIIQPDENPGSAKSKDASLRSAP